MTETSPKVGAGRFQWNAGAWFGGLLGGTAYLLVGGVAFLSQHTFLSAIWLSCFAMALSIGVFVWTRRVTLAPYPAIQVLILVCGLSGAVAIIAALYMAPQLLAAVQLTPSGSLLLLLMFPAFMLWSHFLESTARRTTI